MCEIAPTNGAGSVDEKLRWPGDVVAMLAGAFVEEVVARDGLRIRIGEERVGVAGFSTEIARLLGRVDADGYRLDAGGAELGEMLFDTP